MSTSSRSAFRSWLDKLAATGSLLCALHCAALPLLLALLPELGLERWLGHTFDAVLLAFAMLFGVLSLVPGWRRHGDPRPLRLFALGLAVLWTAVLVPALHDSRGWHALLMTCGGLLVGCAHVSNLRLNRRLEGAHVHGAQCAH